MKQLFLAIVLTVFSFNSHAVGRCMISFHGEGMHDIDHRVISKKNYQETDIMDIREGDTLANIKDLRIEKALSSENSQIFSFVQTIEYTYHDGRELRLRVIHTKKIIAKMPSPYINTFNTPETLALIGKLRSENLPSCRIE